MIEIEINKETYIIEREMKKGYDGKKNWEKLSYM